MTALILKTFLKDSDWVSFFLVWRYLWKYLAHSRHWNNKFKTERQGVEQGRMLISWEAESGSIRPWGNCHHQPQVRAAGNWSPGAAADPGPMWRLQRETIGTIGDDATWLQGHLPPWDSKLSGALSFFLKSEFHLWTSDDRAELGQFHQNYTARLWSYLGSYTIYNQKRNWRPNGRPRWAASRGSYMAC